MKMYGCSIEIFRISESLKFDLVFICKSNSYIFQESMKNERNKQIVTEEIKREMKKGRTENDTGGWEVGGFALYDGLFVSLLYKLLYKFIYNALFK